MSVGKITFGVNIVYLLNARLRNGGCWWTASILTSAFGGADSDFLRLAELGGHNPNEFILIIATT